MSSSSDCPAPASVSWSSLGRVWAARKVADARIVRAHGAIVAGPLVVGQAAVKADLAALRQVAAARLGLAPNVAMSISTVSWSRRPSTATRTLQTDWLNVRARSSWWLVGI